jgi:hypothetical protein
MQRTCALSTDDFLPQLIADIRHRLWLQPTHIYGIGMISITSAVAPGMVR